MQKVEARLGLRRFIPFLRERKPKVAEITSEQVKERRLLKERTVNLGIDVLQEIVIPSNMVNKEGIASLTVTTLGTGNEYTTTVVVYESDKDKQSLIIGRAKFYANSLVEAQEKETVLIDDSVEEAIHNDNKLQEVDDSESQLIMSKEKEQQLREEVSRRYSQRTYTVRPPKF